MAGPMQLYWDKLKSVRAKKKAEREGSKKKGGEGKKDKGSVFSMFKAVKDIKRHKERNRKILESIRK